MSGHRNQERLTFFTALRLLRILKFAVRPHADDFYSVLCTINGIHKLVLHVYPAGIRVVQIAL